MTDPITYNFYGTTVPVLRNISTTVINTLHAAKDEQSKGSLPSDQEILDSNFGDMLPFRVQPILLAKFSLAALEFLKLSKADGPAMNPGFKTLDEVIEFFENMNKVLDNVDEKEYNDAAEKSCDISLGPGKPTLHMTGFADYFHNFVVPNSYFHLNAMYMLLRNAGFKLGKRFYIGSFMSEQQKKDWAPLRG
ncbi:3-oxoacyl-acyl-carrier-protein synthase [Stagonosporopsis vannaccii]|nr:3-oxoacyl-acyl-carrier-protein synthase [Stagonosporopsis vannaccii]